MSDTPAPVVADTPAPDPVVPVEPPVAAPVRPTPALQGPSFSFRTLDASDDPVVPFVFQGEQFHLHPKRVNGMVAMDLTMLDMSSGPMWEFFSGVLGDDYNRFRRIVRSPDIIIEIAEIKRLFDWMTEQAANLPT